MVRAMSEPLATYLHDHLAGANFAIDLVGSLRDRYRDDPLRQLASNLLVELEEDRTILRQIAERVGKGSPDLKEAAAWLLEKASRLKLGHGEPRGLGTFQTLETLQTGIMGRVALWRALGVLAETDDRLRGYDFEALAGRAEAEHASVEASRLAIARTAFSSGGESVVSESR